MTGNKWRVLWDGRHWCVLDPKHGWSIHPWTFDTWTDAIEYADRMARTITITVTLPTYQNLTTVEVDLSTPVTIHTLGTLTHIEAGGMRLNLFRRELEPVALALLAHHYRKGEQ